MTIETVGVDIAKNVFQLHGVNCNGRVVLRRRVMRDGLLLAIAQINRCTIVLEACTGAFFWARKFEALGHQVKVISPQYVKPFVRRQKNDGNDAEPAPHWSHRFPGDSRWLKELISDAAASAETIAEREGCSIRKVNMTISLAFLTPDLVKAAIDGRLPHGMGVARLADLPAEWARQHEMLGLPSQ